ncbi:hypothetical protein [Kitasatospora sp. NPDC088783]|uniref:hypothetical protein n=1 Tax=Kitasatospora sp. NPDC088783 TaxID=3364077 RepID=UPI0037FD7503
MNETAFDALPPHRRRDLAARHPALTPAQISAWIGDPALACPRPPERRGHLPSAALLGDDGRWHLRTGEAMLCAAPAAPGRRRPAAVVRHDWRGTW